MQQSDDTRKPQATRPKNGVLTLGNFDGFHRGHQAIIERVVVEAHKLEGPSVVLTLFPHPGNVLGAPGSVPLLMPLDERIRYLKAAGVDHVEVVPFSRELASLDATEFAEEFIIKPFSPRVVVAGPDTRFGRNRHGDASLLRDLGKHHGFEVFCADALNAGDQKISSSTLRGLIAQGEVAKASEWFGRPYTIRGKVVRGDGRGRTIGIPTANVLIVDYVEPATGVYAVQVQVGAREYSGVANYGKRPTFVDLDTATTVLEVHLLDVEEIDIYGQEVDVRFLAYLRTEKRFNGVDALVEQIGRDIDEARKHFGAAQS